MSDANDPFAAYGSDRTVIKPSAGRPGAAAPAAPAGAAPGGAASAAPAGGREAPMSIDAMMSASLNPLVSAAIPVLAAAPRVRHTARHSNPTGLRDALADGVPMWVAGLHFAGQDFALQVINRIGRHPAGAAFFVAHTAAGAEHFRLLEQELRRRTQGRFDGQGREAQAGQ